MHDDRKITGPCRSQSLNGTGAHFIDCFRKGTGQKAERDKKQRDVTRQRALAERKQQDHRPDGHINVAEQCCDPSAHGTEKDVDPGRVGSENGKEQSKNAGNCR